MDTNEVVRMIKLEKSIKEKIKNAKKEIQLRKNNFVPYDEVKDSKILGVYLYSKKNKYYCFAKYEGLNEPLWDMEYLQHYQEITKEIYEILKK
jgi:hypothetical protein